MDSILQKTNFKETTAFSIHNQLVGWGMFSNSKKTDTEEICFFYIEFKLDFSIVFFLMTIFKGTTVSHHQCEANCYIWQFIYKLSSLLIILTRCIIPRISRQLNICFVLLSNLFCSCLCEQCKRKVCGLNATFLFSF